MEIARKDKHHQDTIAGLEQQLEESDVKLSSFHLDDIKEASNKLEDYYKSQIALVYNDQIEISSKVDVVEIKNEMERGSKILQHTIWTINDAVNDKKAPVHWN